MGVGYNAGGWGAAFGGHKNDNVGLAVQDACAVAVDFLIAQLPNIQWSGSVVMTKGGKVYINRGSREGVTVGDTFSVGEVEVLRDPDTGEVLDESMTEFARLKVDQVKEKLSICTVTSGDAGRVAKGMKSSPIVRQRSTNHNTTTATARPAPWLFVFLAHVVDTCIIRLKSGVQNEGVSTSSIVARSQRRRSSCGSASRGSAIGPEHRLHPGDQPVPGGFRSMRWAPTSSPGSRSTVCAGCAFPSN